MKQLMQTRFVVNENMVSAFAKLTGDYSSLHVDEEFARKSKYRQRLVHGMLPFSFLSVLQNAFLAYRLKFIEFSTRFQNPIFIGDDLLLEIEYSLLEENVYHFKALWVHSQNAEKLIQSKGQFQLIQKSHTSPGTKSTGNDDDVRESFILEDLMENQYTIHEFQGCQERFQFQLTSPSLHAYLASIINQDILLIAKPENLCPNLMSTLLLSTLVGMRLPGQLATFAKFHVKFEQSAVLNDVAELHGKVNNVSLVSESAELGVTFTQNECNYGAGKVSVLVNPPSQSVVSCAHIQQQHMDMHLQDKVVVITGASRGIGATTAKLFAMHGAKVVVNYYQGKKDAQQIVADIEKHQGEAIALQCDIRDEVQVAQFIEKIVSVYGTIDVLVNNAVKEATPKSFMKLEWADYLGELEVSLKGMHNCCKRIVPILKEKKAGKIINLSTIMVDNPVSSQNKYITAKSAVVGYTKSLAKELASVNVQVNLVVPNMTETDLVAYIPSNFSSRIAAERDMGRNLQPIEVAQSIVFLASSWANGITGQKIVLNLGELPFG